MERGKRNDHGLPGGIAFGSGGRGDAAQAPLPRAVDGILFFETHDLMRTPAAVRRAVAAARPGARVVAFGPATARRWAIPVNAIVRSVARRYVVRLRNGGLDGEELGAVAERLLAGRGTLTMLGGGSSADYLLSLGPDAVLGEALAALTQGRMDVLTCHEERSEVEEAFLVLTGEEGSER